MRDELDGRMWVEFHDGFAEAVDGAAKALRSGLTRLAPWDGTTPHLLALALAFTITVLSFNTTAA